jgi:hypothetical protein
MVYIRIATLIMLVSHAILSAHFVQLNSAVRWRIHRRIHWSSTQCGYNTSMKNIPSTPHCISDYGNAATQRKRVIRIRVEEKLFMRMR